MDVEDGVGDVGHAARWMLWSEYSAVLSIILLWEWVAKARVEYLEHPSRLLLGQHEHEGHERRIAQEHAQKNPPEGWMGPLHPSIWEVSACKPDHGNAHEENGPSELLEHIFIFGVDEKWFGAFGHLFAETKCASIEGESQKPEREQSPGGVEVFVEVVIGECVVRQDLWGDVRPDHADCLLANIPLL